jgi:sugar lactone lactonase YvrE
MKFKYLMLVALLAFALPVVAQETTPEAILEEIVIEVPGILPEGVEYDAEGERFLFGSLTEGTIRQITEGGEAEPFIEDEELVSSVGIHVDTANNRLLVANSDASIFFGGEGPGMAMVAAYDLETGERLFMTDLGALVPDSGHFANDLTVDASGNVYVTDSLTPVIYMVSMNGDASIFLLDQQLMGEGFGLNGIDYHPDRYLLVATGSAIYKIQLDDSSEITEVELSEPLSIDGMVLAPDGTTLYAVAATGDLTTGGLQEVVEITSEDDWTTAEVTARIETGGNATTVTLRDGTPYFINVYFGNPDAEQYEIVPVSFEAVG